MGDLSTRNAIVPQTYSKGGVVSKSNLNSYGRSINSTENATDILRIDRNPIRGLSFKDNTQDSLYHFKLYGAINEHREEDKTVPASIKVRWGYWTRNAKWGEIPFSENWGLTRFELCKGPQFRINLDVDTKTSGGTTTYQKYQTVELIKSTDVDNPRINIIYLKLENIGDASHKWFPPANFANQLRAYVGTSDGINGTLQWDVSYIPTWQELSTIDDNNTLMALGYVMVDSDGRVTSIKQFWNGGDVDDIYEPFGTGPFHMGAYNLDENPDHTFPNSIYFDAGIATIGDITAPVPLLAIDLNDEKYRNPSTNSRLGLTAIYYEFVVYDPDVVINPSDPGLFWNKNGIYTTIKAKRYEYINGVNKDFPIPSTAADYYDFLENPDDFKHRRIMGWANVQSNTFSEEITSEIVDWVPATKENIVVNKYSGPFNAKMYSPLDNLAEGKISICEGFIHGPKNHSKFAKTQIALDLTQNWNTVYIESGVVSADGLISGNTLKKQANDVRDDSVPDPAAYKQRIIIGQAHCNTASSTIDAWYQIQRGDIYLHHWCSSCCGSEVINHYVGQAVENEASIIQNGATVVCCDPLCTDKH